MKKANILIIEDDTNQRDILVNYLTYRGLEVESARTGFRGLELLEDGATDLVLLDWRLPDTDGLEVLLNIKEKRPLVQVIMITAFGTVEHAVEAIRHGAYYYLTKPVNFEELLLLMEKALHEQHLEREVNDLRDRLRVLTVPEASDIVAQSDSMKEILSLTGKVAVTDATVLILGESGVGKGVLASLIHSLSYRKDESFLEINCAAIPEGLLESELFGYEKGAFTGANHPKRGLFEAADRGTIFLDEIGDLPLSLQGKLLRVLEDGTFHRVGGLKKISVDVRVVAATNHDLETMIKSGAFREDLYWRLNVFSIKVTPLRKRREDIVPLANYFLEKYISKHNKKLTGFSREAIGSLLSYHFPGNVREMENIVERAVILAEDKIITKNDLPFSIYDKTDGDLIQEHLETLPLQQAVSLLERLRIEKALENAQGIKLRAAALLGISERKLRYKMKKYKMDRFSS